MLIGRCGSTHLFPAHDLRSSFIMKEIKQFGALLSISELVLLECKKRYNYIQEISNYIFFHFLPTFSFYLNSQPLKIL